MTVPARRTVGIRGDELTRPWGAAMGRHLRALTSSAAIATALALLATPAMSAVPPVVTTPAVPSSITYWGTDGPIIGTPAGTLFGDGSVRSTASPQVRIPLAPADAALVATRDAMPLNAYSSWPDLAADDVYVVGSHVTATTTSPVVTRDATFWALDVATGSLRTRGVTGLDVFTSLVGSTGDAWVTAPYNAVGPVTLWPFSGSAPHVLTLPGVGRVLTAGTAGVVYLSTGDSSLASRRLLLAPADGSAVVTVVDFASDPRYASARADDISVATSAGAVGWSVDATVGYWDAGTGPLSAPCAPCGTPSVQRGAVALFPASVQLVDSGFVAPAPWQAWTVGFGTLVPAPDSSASASVLHLLWPSATATGGAAFGGLAVSLGYSADMHSPVADRWVLWSPGSAPTTPVAGPSTGAAVRSVQGSLGGLLTTYQSAVPTGTRGANGTVAWLRQVRDGSTSPLFGVQRAVPVGQFGLETGYGLGYPWSAIPEWTDNATKQELVLRTGQYVRGRVPLGTVRIRAIAQSGPITLFVAGTVLRSTDAYGATSVLSRSATPRIAQDGVLSAYQTTDGRIWLRDINSPITRSNPRVVAWPCGRASVACTQRLWLSAGRLVVQYTASSGHRLLVVDTTRRTSRTVALGNNPFCDAMSGRVLACRNAVTGRVVTLDTGATALVFRPVAGAILAPGAISTPTAFVGRRLARPTGIDPQTGRPTTVTIATVPLANADRGATRLLGPIGARTVSGGRTMCVGWSPQWSFTDPVSSFTVTLRNPANRVVRVWKGSSADGVIRGVWWCPTTASPLGTYRWTLTGRSAYGAVRDVTGTTTAAVGSLVVRRMYPATVTIAIPRTTTPAGTITVTGRLVRTDTRLPVAGRVLTLWRSYSSTGWALVGDGVTNARGTVVWRTVVPRTMYYQVRYAGAVDLAGAASARTLVTAAG